MQNIDVEKIMEEIRAEIKEKGYKPEDLDFSDIAVEVAKVNPDGGYNEGEMQGQLAFLNSHYNNPIYFPLQGNPVKVFVQRAIRRALLFVIFPGFQFQTRYNVAAVRALNQVKNYMEEQQKEMDELKAEIAGLKAMLLEQKEEKSTQI